MGTKQSQLHEIAFTGRYVSLKYRIYLYDYIRNYEIKQN